MKMNYTVFGTNDMQRAAAFYDALWQGTGLSKVHAEGRMTVWANDDLMFGIAEPYDGEKATNGNGTMIGFNLESADEVSRLHAKALNLGGSCEGVPEERSGRFSAYVRDLDQNKICFFL